MEGFPSDSARKNLENELTHGGELAKQLQLLLNAQSSSKELVAYLLNEILMTFDRALSSAVEYGGNSCNGAMMAVMSDSPAPPRLTGSPHSNHSDQAASWTSEEKEKRRWTQKVVVFGETGNETQLDDGHSWRKYGQKDILGSKHPRGYYRCTDGKGCLARKQVQRSDNDPTAYEVTYKRLHTCHNNPPIPIPIPINQPQNEPKTPLSHENQINQSQEEPFPNIQTNLKIIDRSDDTKQHNIPSSSNFNPGNSPIFADDEFLWEDAFLLDFMHPAAPDFDDYEGLFNN